MTWSIAAPAVTAAFLASLVEVVEAFTIVLAVATLRGWRSAVLGATAGQGVVWYTGQYYALFYLQTVLKVNLRTGFIIVALAMLFGMPFFTLFGALSDKIGRRQIIMSSMTMTAVVIGCMIFAGGTGWFVLLVALLCFFLFAVRAVMQAWLLDATPPGMGGSAIGLLFGTQAIGAAFGPVSAGLFADHYGIMSAFYFLAGTIVIANLMVFVTPSNLREEPQVVRL